MHVGAILTVPSTASIKSEGPVPQGPIAEWEILGSSLQNRMLERMRIFGIGEIAIVPEHLSDNMHSFWEAWDASVSRYLNFGVEVLILARLGPYVELDFADFLSFHREMGSALTEVCDSKGALDTVAINAAYLRSGSGTFRSRLRSVLPKQQRYLFHGYSNRLKHIRDFRRLAKDALLGRAAIHLLGTEVAANVWVGEGAQIHESVEVRGPAYIGNNCRVRPGVIISGASAIERNCEVDCGTTIDDACVLPGTYIGPGLNVCGAVASKNTLFHLGCNVGLQFRDRHLIAPAISGRGWLPSRFPVRADLGREYGVQ